jgi:hypothetical protein
MECPVCLADCATTTKLHCGHAFCFPCLKQWLVKTITDTPSCPMCRATIRFKGLKKIEEDLEAERFDEQYTEAFDEVICDIIKTYMELVQVLPVSTQRHLIPLMSELKTAEETFNAMKNLYMSDPDEITGEMLDYGLELNYKTENRRIRREQWQGRDKFAFKYNRMRVKNIHR